MSIFLKTDKIEHKREKFFHISGDIFWSEKCRNNYKIIGNNKCKIKSKNLSYKDLQS